jgi:hypothetical protein
VDNGILRDVARFQQTTRKTMMKTMELVNVELVKVITKSLPDNFGLVFDGWTDESSNHYVALFAVYPEARVDHETGERFNGREDCLLAIAPLPQQDNLGLGADSHIEFFQSTLSWYNKTLANVIFLVSDNCNTNLSISDRTHNPLIGCARIPSIKPGSERII